MHTKIFLSNRTEELLSELKRELFSGETPFCKRLVVVSSPLMKSWLSWQFAKDPRFEIAMGLEICYLNQAIFQLAQLLGGKPLLFPSHLALSFALEKEISEALQSEGNPLLKPLAEDLGLSSGRAWTKRARRRLAKLSSELAGLFMQYGLYGAGLKWGEKREFLWQKLLWDRIWSRYPGWSTPLESLVPLIGKEPREERSLSVHLFALSFLPNLYLSFLKGLGESLSVRSYLISPCAEFWSELPSDRERARLSRKADLFDPDRNLLLGNLGRLGKKMAAQIEESDLWSEERFFLPERESLLTALQRDLALMRDPEREEPIDLPKERGSIQVHLAPSRAREVQILKEALFKLIREEGLLLSEILVLAPDISLYQPHIEAVFGGLDSPLDYQIYDLKLSGKASLVQAFLSLLELSSSRWEASRLLELFRFPSVKRALGLSDPDLDLWRKWVIEANISWGRDREHRLRILEGRSGSKRGLPLGEQGTWRAGFKQLLSRLVREAEEPISPTEAERLGRLIECFEGLERSLSPLEDGLERTLSEWACCLHALLEDYFAPGEGDAELFEELRALLLSLNSAEKSLGKTLYGWVSIKQRLDEAFSEKSVSYRERSLEAVRFSSLLPMRSIPAEAIAVLGLGEGLFPRSKAKSCYDLLSDCSSGDYIPSGADYDRFAFLEAILSARRALLLSCPIDSAEAAPSLLISELIAYLDSAFRVEGRPPGELIVFSHPASSFDKSYFEEGPLFSFSKRTYRLALASAKRGPSPSLIPEWFGDQSLSLSAKVLPDGSAIPLRSFFQAAANPLRCYFQETLGLPLLDRKQRAPEDEDPFLLDPLERSAIRKRALEGGLDRALKEADERGILPRGVFRELAIKKIEEELQAWGGARPMEMHFDLGCQRPERCSESCFVLPALECRHEGRSLFLVGELSDLSPRGLVASGEGGRSDRYKIWPKLLVLGCSNPFGVELAATWRKSSKHTSFSLEDPQGQLQRYLAYYLTCLNHPSPLSSVWIEELVRFEGEALRLRLKKRWGDEKSFKYQPEYLWAARGEGEWNLDCLAAWKKLFLESIEWNALS